MSHRHTLTLGGEGQGQADVGVVLRVGVGQQERVDLVAVLHEGGTQPPGGHLRGCGEADGHAGAQAPTARFPVAGRRSIRCVFGMITHRVTQYSQQLPLMCC